MHTPAIGVYIFLRYDWIFVKAELILVTKLGVVVAAYTLVIQIDRSIIHTIHKNNFNFIESPFQNIIVIQIL